MIGHSGSRPSRHSQGGFTLLEIMIALAVVSGLLLTLITTVNYHLGIAGRHEFLTIGSMLAKGKLLELEQNPAASKGAFPDPFADYSYETAVKPSLLPNTSEISVVVKKNKEEVRLSEIIGSKVR